MNEQENLDNLGNQDRYDMACQHIRNGNPDAALPLLRQLVAAEPTDALGLRLFADVLNDKKQFEESIEIMRRVVALVPMDGSAWGKLGASYGFVGEWEKSRKCYAKSLYYAPFIPDTHWNYALCCIQHGDFETGWREYQWGRVNGQRPTRTLSPEWDGSFAPETLFIHTEQGFGDTMMFLQLLALFRERFPNTEVTLEVQRDLIPLLSSQEIVKDWYLRDQIPQSVHSTKDMPHDVKEHIGLLSLPYVLKLKLEDLPCATNYLVAPNPTTASRQEGNPLRVGICWEGSAGHGNAWQRNIPIECFAPLNNIPGVVYISLQKNAALSVLSFESVNLYSWADTANAIDSLDLVITCDTGVAHLAGAMGKETWILLPFASDYRWLLDRVDSPWYPTVRLFRQETRGDWGPVIHAVRKEFERRTVPSLRTQLEVGGYLKTAGIGSENPDKPAFAYVEATRVKGDEFVKRKMQKPSDVAGGLK